MVPCIRNLLEVFFEEVIYPEVTFRGLSVPYLFSIILSFNDTSALLYMLKNLSSSFHKGFFHFFETKKLYLAISDLIYVECCVMRRLHGVCVIDA